MDFFSIPSELVDANLLPYLEWNDLLRFRRVCKWTKEITDDYLKVHPELAPEIQINEEGSKSFKAFLEMGIPTTRIFLNNTSGADFYENCGNEVSSFLEQFGPLIKHLRVDQISLIVFGKEYNFLNALKNLESFEAKSYGGYRRGLTNAEAVRAIAIQQRRYRLESPMYGDGRVVVFPEEILKRLKVFKIGNNEERVLANTMEYNQTILSLGGSLQSLAIPFNPLAQPRPGGFFDVNHHEEGQLFLTFTVLIFHMDFPDEKPDLANCKELDFANFHDYVHESLRCQVEYQGSPMFVRLLETCSKAGIKLFNVAPSWLQGRQGIVRPPNIGPTIISLVNIDPRIFSVDLPNLEKIVITGTSKSSPGVDWEQNRPDWPALKSLEITVDSKDCRYSEWRADINRPASIYMKIKELYNFLFQDVSRLALTDLKLEFKEGEGALPCPKIELIVDSCPNLKKLSLVNWQGSNKDLAKFWSGLPGLEEVSLERCKGVGNAAFVGKTEKAPVFLTLKKLKKLSLKGLDRMPKITDTLFSLVIRHLELTHLFLSSDAPLKSVTLSGVRSLCEGKFAESIQKFPFQDWRLSNVSEDQFKQLEVLFRSYNML